MTSSRKNDDNQTRKTTDFSIDTILNRTTPTLTPHLRLSPNQTSPFIPNALQRSSINAYLPSATNSRPTTSPRSLDQAGRNEFVSFECASPTIIQPFPWLQCTRYCPPKVPRKREGGPQRRQLGRHPRIPFTSQQLSILEDRFRQSPYLSSEEVTRLSAVLQLADIRVKIWFQNRRARERRERLQTDRQPSPSSLEVRVKQEDEEGRSFGYECFKS